MRLLATYCMAMGLLLVPLGSAFGAVVDFDGFNTGSVDGQGGWTVKDSFGNSSFTPDQEIVNVGQFQLWRLSNAVHSTGYSDQPFSPTTAVAGETGSYLYNDYGTDHLNPENPPLPGASATTNLFSMSLNFKSVTGAAQSGLAVTLSPSAKQSTVRMSYLRIGDTGSGFDLLFYDTYDGANWLGTTVASGLSYTDWHNITMDIEFVDGVDNPGLTPDGNDIVDISVNGTLVHTGTTWESYYHVEGEGVTEPRLQAVNSMLFRVNTAAPGVAGNGLYFGVVPEPSTLAIWSLFALCGIGFSWRRRRKA